jgi:hypothetical protein
MSELTEADLTIVHMALDAYLSGPPLTTNGLTRVLTLSRKLGIHGNRSAAATPPSARSSYCGGKYEKSGATRHD